MPYLWPATLRLPARPPKIVYLDLNHWIRLSQAMAGHPRGADSRDTLESCLRARRRGDALFPISDSIYIEAAKIGPHRQRRHLRDVVEELSGYAVVTARHVIAEHEVEALLDEFLGRSRDPINPMDYLDWGVARAFGMVGGFRVKQRAAEGREIDLTDQTRSDWPDGPAAFDRLLAEGELALQRAMIEGPPHGGDPGRAGRVRVEVAGSWWTVEAMRRDLPATLDALKPQRVAWYPSGPAAAMTPYLSALEGSHEIKGTQVNAACMGLADARRRCWPTGWAASRAAWSRTSSFRRRTTCASRRTTY